VFFSKKLGSTTSKHCLELLPRLSQEKAGVQKAVIGDHNGVLCCFGRQKNACNVS